MPFEQNRASNDEYGYTPVDKQFSALSNQKSIRDFFEADSQNKSYNKNGAR